MARRGRPQGNKRQREQAKARKKREKEARREARKAGDEPIVLDEDGFPIEPPAEGEPGTEQPVEGEAPTEEGILEAGDEERPAL